MPKPPKTGDDCVWTTEDDRLLLAHLQQEKAAGNQAQSGWKPSVWQPIMAQYAEAKGQQGGTKTKEKIKSHWQKMKSEFNTVYQLFENSSGFGYDSERKMVTAPPNVWTEKVKVNKAFARYQTAPYLWWNEMNDLVGGLSATGSGALHLAAGAPSSNPPSPPQSSLPTIKNIAQHKSTVPKSRSGSVNNGTSDIVDLDVDVDNTSTFEPNNTADFDSSEDEDEEEEGKGKKKSIR